MVAWLVRKNNYMNPNLEELYLEAEADIRNSNYVDALKKYETILMDEPDNGPTLNSLGWLYKTQLEDYSKAETFYLACIKCSPLYPHAYNNYATLLTDMERFEELTIHLQHCFEVPTIEKSWVFMKFGLMEELKLNFQEAITFYEKATLVTLNDDKLKEYNEDIRRCCSKLELSKQHAAWIEAMRK
jgi:tetratricopeptide (TPR) repeat protein